MFANIAIVKMWQLFTTSNLKRGYVTSMMEAVETAQDIAINRVNLAMVAMVAAK